MASARVDIAIVGGGVIGAACAWFLARRGARPLVVEGASVAHAASGKAAGLLSPLMPPADRETAAIAPLTERGASLHATLAELLDGPNAYGYAPFETCAAARNADEAALLRERAAEVGGEWIAPDALAERCAWLDRPAAGGLLVRSAQLDPAAFTQRLMESATGMGASLRIARAAGLLGGPEGVTGVELEGGDAVLADAVVLALGPWTHRAAAWLDLPLPVRPLKGEIVHLEPAREPPPGGFSDFDGQYAVTKPTGVVFAGTTAEEAGFDDAPTPAARERILADVALRTSRLADARVVDQTACLRPLSADGLPLIGAAPGRRGAWVATGHGRKGILLSLATGEAIAELILDGRAALDLAPFDPARFGTGA